MKRPSRRLGSEPWAASGRRSPWASRILAGEEPESNDDGRGRTAPSAQRGEDEGFYVLEGSATIHVGDESVTLTAGQHAFGPRKVPHRFDIGPEGAHMLWVLTPGGFEALVEEASVPATTPTLPPADIVPPEDIADIVRRHGNELLG